MKKKLLLFAASFCVLALSSAQGIKRDSSFGTNGVVTTGLGESYIYNGPPAYQVLPQADGTMYVLEGNSITKRKANGSVDSSFRIDGNLIGTNGSIKNAVLQADGKIVVAGSIFVFVSESDFALARFNTDGSIDRSFSEDGIQTTDFGSDDIGYSVAIQKDGKIIVAGLSYGHLAMARYNTNGSPDKSFGSDGMVTNKLLNGAAITIQKDGKVVVGGSVNLKYDTESGSYLSDFAVVRYNIDGSLDVTFGGDGMQTTDFSSGSDIATAVVIQNDGKIVAAGYSAKGPYYYISDFALARYNLDGSLDKSFSGDGKQSTSFGSSVRAQVNAAAIQPDGKIVVAGYVNGYNQQQGNYYNFTVARYKEDGSLDKSFSDDGKTSDFSSRDNPTEALTIAIQNDGKIVSGGFVSNAYGNSHTALLRYNTNGRLDNTFDNDGKLVDGSRGGNTIFTGTAVQTDGRIVSVGRTWNGNNFDFAIVRYNVNGSLDSTFSNDGKQTIGFGTTDDYANAVTIQNDGKIIVAGFSGKIDSSWFSIVRFNSDGSPDKTFDSDGKIQTSFGTNLNQAYSVAIQSDGKIVAAGSAKFFGEDDPGFAVARFNSNGSLDNSFSGDGKQIIRFAVPGDEELGEMEGYANLVAIQSDNKIVVGGISSGTPDPFTCIARFNTNGSLDSTFSNDGKATMGTETYASSFAIQKDGKLVVMNNFDYRGTAGIDLARFNTDGTLDQKFDKDGIAVTQFPYYSGIEISSMALQNNGKIIVAGTHFFRYNTTGSPDSTFGGNGEITTEGVPRGSRIVIFNDKLYVSGGSGYGSVTRYLLKDNSQTPPAVTLTTPTNNTTRLAPAAHIKLSAVATDKDGTISKVEFYSGTHLLHTETVIPYGFVWRNVGLGNYTLTAKAYDNDGLVTTSAPVHISVVPNKPPVVSIINPKNNETFAASANIQIEADAKDADGRMARVEFYNGSTLLNTQYQLPYRFVWKDVPAGTYTITAVARDNWGARTTSAPVTFTVISNSTIVSSRPGSANNKTGVSDAASITLSPNPANTIINLYTTGLQQDKPSMIRVLSASGVEMKMMHSNSSAKTIQLNVSSLTKGVYTVQLISGDKILYKQFVKL